MIDTSLPPLPEPDVQVRGYGTAGGDGGAFSAERMHAFRAEGVAAEREMWTAPVQAMLDAHDAGLVRLGKMMQEHGISSFRIPGGVQAELDAIEGLRAAIRATPP